MPLALVLLPGWGEGASAERLIVGIDHDFPPHQYLDDDGRPTGFDLESFRAVAELQGIEFEVQSGPWHEIRRRLEAGEIDVSPGMVATKSRDKLLEFSVPSVVVQHVVFVPKDSGAKHPKELIGKVVTVERGALWHDLIIERGLDIDLEAVETPSQVLRRVAEGDAAGAILLYKQGLFLIRHHGLTGIRALVRRGAKGVVELRFALPEGRTELLAQLNDGLAAIRASGRYDEVYDRWFGVLREKPLWERPVVRVLSLAFLVAMVLFLAALLWSQTLRRRVSERTRDVIAAEKEQGNLQAQLLQAQKMEALGRLAGGVAHDFNNVLTVIQGGLYLARESVAENDQKSRLLDSALTAAESDRQLIEQLLTFSHQQEAKPQRLSWNRLFEEQGEMLRRLAGSPVRIEFDLAPDLMEILIDPSQASQIVLNLVVNARDSMEGGGTIHISTSNVELEGGLFARLSVSDNGSGIDAETRERIFEPFFTTKGEGGSGLGLATVFGIVTRGRGTVHLGSDPGRGSVFHVDLPRAPALSSRE